jgi:hypothetical protein
MAIIAFWSDEEKETGQTMSMVALSTYMAIEHNYKILNVSTSFKDNTLESSYWDLQKIEQLVKTISKNTNAVGLESGVEGLIKIINSNKTSTNIVSNYTKVVFKDRLDVLCATKTQNYEEYREIAQLYPNILQVANRSYDLVFVDISKRMPKEQVDKILEIANVVIVNMTQRLKTIDDFINLREENEFFKGKNILVNIGRYDKFSKYNVKNITRYMKEKKDVHAIPYNTLFFESCSEGKVAEFFLKLRRVEQEDRNAVFIEETSRLAKDLIYKLQELQLKI